MTERSWLWEGTTTGDATLAPYTRLRFNRWFSGPYSNSDNTKVHVIPGYLDNLLVRALPGTLNIVTVKAGAALVGDYLYINETPAYLTIPSNTLSTTKRVDILALRIDNTVGSPDRRTVKLVHIKGFETLYTEATLIPVLAQDENGFWEVEVARIFVNSNNFTLEQKHISSQVGYINLFDQFSPAENLVVNSEFLVPEYDSGTLEYLGSWVWTNSGSTIAPAAGIGTETRARCASVTNAALTDILNQNVAFKRVDKIGRHFFIAEGLVQPAQNNGKIIVRINALSDTQVTYQSELIHDIGIFGEPSATTKRFLEIIDFDDADADNPLVSLNIEIINDGTATDDYKVGPIQISRGFYSGGLQAQHEVVFLEQMLTDASWAFNAKSSGTTTINMLASFGAVIPAYLKGVILKVECNDSGSAGSVNCGLDIYRYDGTMGVKHGGVDLSGTPNDSLKSEQIIVPFLDYWKNGNTASMRIQAVVRATGAATLDALIEVVGLIL